MTARPKPKSIKEETTQSFFEALYAANEADAHQVAERIFLGAASAAVDRKAMQKRKITHVMICHPALKENHPQAFKYGRCPLIDIPDFNLLELLPDALGFLCKARAAGGAVFVYCAKGISRSASLVTALLMLEQKMGFEDAFKALEQKRPIVYPNVGFQQQLRHLESLLATSVDRSANLQAQVEQLRKVVPRGSLGDPSSPLQIAQSIGSCMEEAIDALEGLVDKVCGQPQLLQQRELWKRQGLFFENLHKYKALPSDPNLLERARGAAEKLRSLPRIFSESLKGVKLALAVAKELEGWERFAEPVLSQQRRKEEKEEEPGPAVAAPAAKKVKEAALPDISDSSDSSSSSSSESSSDSSSDEKPSKKKKKKKEKKEKKKLSKKEKKLQKKIKKAAKKAAKVEKAAKKAELAALQELKEAELAAERAEQREKELQALEEQEAFEAKAAAAAARAEQGRAGGRSPSVSEEEAPSDSEGGGSAASSGSLPRPAHRRRLD